MQRAVSRPFLYLAFAAGCAGALWMDVPLYWAPVAALLMVGARRQPPLCWATPVLLVVFGLAWGAWRIPVLSQDPLIELARRSPEGAFLWVRGRVLAAEPWTDGTRADLAAEAFRDGERWVPCGTRLRAYLPVPAPLPGSAFEASLKVSVPPRGTNPGQWDMRQYLAREGFGLTASCRSANLFQGAPPSGWHLLARYRAAVETRLLADGGQSGGALLAILLGERGLLEPGQVDVLSASGLYHLVALSGFNVGLLLIALAVLAHALGLHPRRRDWISLALLAAYGAVVAGQPSLARALLMATVFLAARLLARPQGGLLAWSAALALLLAWDPNWIVDAGFQLTFAATLGILLLWDAYPSFLPRPGMSGSLVRLHWIGLAAQVATLPFIALAFHRVSLLGWLATPLASLPLMAVQVLGTAYMFGLAFVPWVHQLLGRALDLLTRLFLFLPSWLGEGRWGTVFLETPPWGWVALYGGAAILLCIPGRARRAGWVVAAAAVVGAWCVPALFPQKAPPSVAVLDVGQASCQVLRWEDHALLMDAGNGAYRGPTSGRTVVEPYLAAAGLRALDGIILTHWDADHSGSVEDLLMDLPVGFLAFPATGTRQTTVSSRIAACAQRRRTRLVPLERGQTLSWSGATLEVLHPPVPPGLPDENDHSLVCRAALGRSSVCFTGDLEAPGEAQMVSGGWARPSYAFLVPHHGSATSSTPAWLAALEPRLALVSVGRGNRFGHPSAQVLHRLAARGVRVARTDLDGALLLDLGRIRPVLWRMRDGDWSGALK